jgi:hypothetical protein
MYQLSTYRREAMQKFMISCAAIAAAAALLTSVPTRAEFNYGPLQNGNQCFHPSPNSTNSKDFGYWKTCAQSASVSAPASAGATAPVHRKKRNQ